MTPQFDGFGGPLPLPAETRRWGHVRKSCRTERQDRTRPREPRGARLPAGDFGTQIRPKEFPRSPAATPRPRLTARKVANLPFLRIISQEVNVPTDYYATGYLERDTKPHSGSSYKRIKDGLLQELVNYVMERSSDQRGLYRITVGENVYTGLEIEKLYDQSDFPRG
jgi:hypothetical protein